MMNAKHLADYHSLFNEARKGQRQAQEYLILITQKKLYKFCILLGNDFSSAEDLCQETYIKALSHLEQLDKPEAFQGWLYQIARNLHIDFLRKQKKLKNYEPLDDIKNQFNPIDQYDLLLDLQKRLSQLDLNDRFLIILIEIEGFSYKEAAHWLKMSEDAVRTRLHRLRMILKNNI